MGKITRRELSSDILTQIDDHDLNITKLYGNISTLGNKFEKLEDRVDSLDIIINAKDYPTLQESLDTAKNNNNKTIIYIPPGEYLINDTLKIYKNTELILAKTAIIKKNSTSFNVMLLNGDLNAEYDSYEGNSNITIIGGIWDGNFDLNSQSNIMSFGKASNIHLENITYKNVTNNHHLEFSGVTNATVRNCIFTGYKDITSDKSRSYCEAIQISTHTKDGFPFFGTYDNSPTTNVLIENYLFKNLATGAGSHGIGYGSYDSDIKIINNTFENCSYAGFRSYAMKKVIVSGNIFHNCRSGILNSYSPANASLGRPTSSGSEDIIITDNVFSTDDSVSFTFTHQVYIMGGCTSSTDYVYAKGIIISNNTFRNIKDKAIRLQICMDILVTNNIVNGCNGFIYADYIDYTNITDNIIKNSTESVINIARGSSQMPSNIVNSFNRIKCNFIENCAKNAITAAYLYDSFISENMLHKVCTASENSTPAISLHNMCKKVSLEANILRNYQIKCNHGIYISANSEIITTRLNDMYGMTSAITNNGINGSFDGFIMMDNGTKKKKSIRIQNGEIVIYDN